MSGTLDLQNVDDAIILSLQLRALRKGRSPEEEYREILTQKLASELMADFITNAAALRAQMQGCEHTPSEILQREGRRER